LEYANISCGIDQTCGESYFKIAFLSVAKEICVHVDFEKDKIDVASHDIIISADINNIIWTIQKLICKNSIGLYLSPIHDNRSRIPKHNYIYINILISQSEDNQHALEHYTE